MSGRQVKDALYEQFARMGKAVASPKRIELLDLLCQGERSVEALATATRMGLTNTSAHLQVLRQARLVETRREGVKVFYRVADDGVCRFTFALRDLGRERLAEVEQVVRDYFDASHELEPVSRGALLERIDRGEVAVIDVRPAEEYAAGHVPGRRLDPPARARATVGGAPHRRRDRRVLPRPVLRAGARGALDIAFERVPRSAARGRLPRVAARWDAHRGRVRWMRQKVLLILNDPPYGTERS